MNGLEAEPRAGRDRPGRPGRCRLRGDPPGLPFGLGTFAAWCDSWGVSALPAHPATVAAYRRHLEGLGRRLSTISRALASISEGHKAAGHESPQMVRRYIRDAELFTDKAAAGLL